MKTTHYVMIAHELSGDSELFFYHTEEEAENKLKEFLSGIKDLFDLEVDVEEEKLYKSMYINDVPEFDYCSVFVKVGSITTYEWCEDYFANFAPSIYESDLFIDTREKVVAEVKRYEDDYAKFYREEMSSEDEIQIHFHLEFMDAIDTIRAGKIKYQ